MSGERIFIGLWPDSETCRAIQNLQSSLALAGRAVPPENLHVTLAFVGSCDVGRRDCVLQALRTVRERQFDLEFDELGYFERHHLFYLNPSIPPTALLTLHKRLCRALSACRFKAPRIFKPHVTLFRGVQTPPSCGALHSSIKWSARSLHVMRSQLSEEGARYTSLREYDLL